MLFEPNLVINPSQLSLLESEKLEAKVIVGVADLMLKYLGISGMKTLMTRQLLRYPRY